MKWRKDQPGRNGHRDDKLLWETRRLREQLVAVAAKLEVYLKDFQEEVNHQRDDEDTSGRR